MNLILIRGGYSPIAVRPQDRFEYTQALQQAQQIGGSADRFDRLLLERLNATLEEYASVLAAAPVVKGAQQALPDRY